MDLRKKNKKNGLLNNNKFVSTFFGDLFCYNLYYIYRYIYIIRK